MEGKDVERVSCPFCRAEYTVPKTYTYATCPYCGTTFRLGRPDAKVDHYLFAAVIDKNSAYRYVKEFALMQVGVAEDLDVNSSFESSYLYYIPLYLYEVNIKAVCRGGQEVVDDIGVKIDVHGGEETAYIVKPAVQSTPIPIPQGYGFPARGRRFFKPAVLSDGVYLQPSLDPEAVFEHVKRPYLDKAVNEAAISCRGGYDVNDSSRFIGIAHYPFWLVRYRYRGKAFIAVVDAADGTVLYMEYPLSPKRRMKGLLGGVLALIMGISIAILISVFAGSALTGFIGGAIAALPGFGVALSRFIKSMNIYRYRPGEEAVFIPMR